MPGLWSPARAGAGLALLMSAGLLAGCAGDGAALLNAGSAAQTHDASMTPALEDISKSSHEFFAMDGLWKQISCSRPQRDKLGFRVCVSCQNYDRRAAQLSIGSNGSKDIQSIDIGHMNNLINQCR